MIGGLALFSAISARGGIHPASGIFVLVLAFAGLAWFVFIKKEKEEAKTSFYILIG